MNTTGAAVAWLADLAYGGRSGRAGPADYGRLDAEAGAVPPGADGVLALAVLGDGERTDPDLRGAVVGLSLRHDRGTLARAVLEGAAFAIRGPAGSPASWRRAADRAPGLRRGHASRHLEPRSRPT